MIHSMTGFGEASREDGDRTFHLELRSVNNRYLKTVLYLPDEYGPFESELERLLRGRITRGSITLRLQIREHSPRAVMEINTAVLQAYVEQLRASAGEDPRAMIDLATLLTLPGVAQPVEISDEERAARWEQLRSLAEQALERMIGMRATEGRSLAADLADHCDRICESLARIRARAPLVVREYRDRLKSRVAELIADSGIELAENDLLREVSIYAERSDISEELSRLSAHVEQFTALMESPEASGRRLEFVAQEMLREANTIGSKTGDAEIAREIIEIKGAVDRIKEQVQNAE